MTDNHNESEPVTVSLTEEERSMPVRERLMREHNDGIQHGIDDDPENDAAKGGVLGAVGGAAVGGAAGAMLGPVGAVAGALLGAGAGALASALAVGAVDSVDNDDNITGIGPEISIDDQEIPTPQMDSIIREKLKP